MRSFLVLLFPLIMIAANGCSTKRPGEASASESESQIMNEGRKTVATTFGTLSSALKGAMAFGGVEHAVSFCNVNAMTLTDSLGRMNNALIKRATDRPRNPSNRLTDEEQMVFNHYQKAIAEGHSYSDTLIAYTNRSVYYAPIRMNDLCLKCHGDPNTIEAYDLIRKRYPEDKAIGYTSGELRGIWTVSFRDNSEITKHEVLPRGSD